APASRPSVSNRWCVVSSDHLFPRGNSCESNLDTLSSRFELRLVELTETDETTRAARLQGWEGFDILKARNEDSPRAVQSHGRRFRREFDADSAFGGASARAGRRSCRVFRALPLRIPAPGPARTACVHRAQSGRAEVASGEAAAACGCGLCRTKQERHG